MVASVAEDVEGGLHSCRIDGRLLSVDSFGGTDLMVLGMRVRKKEWKRNGIE